MSKNTRLVNGFGQVSNSVMRDPRISLTTKAVYSYLCTYTNSQTNECTVGVDKMAAELNVTQSTIKRALRDMKEHGIISRQKRAYGLTYVTVLLK